MLKISKPRERMLTQANGFPPLDCVFRLHITIWSGSTDWLISLVLEFHCLVLRSGSRILQSGSRALQPGYRAFQLDSTPNSLVPWCHSPVLVCVCWLRACTWTTLHTSIIFLSGRMVFGWGFSKRFSCICLNVNLDFILQSEMTFCYWFGMLKLTVF